jgi:hypothetical protein
MIFKSVKISLAFSLLFSLLSACGGNGELTVTDAWARPAAAGGNGALYFEIDNRSGQDDVLLRVESDAASVLEMHSVMMVDPSTMDMGGDDSSMEMSEGDMVMQMAPQTNVPVPKGQSLLFAPGSYHVMMIGLNEDLLEGQTFNVTLVFENAGALTVAVVIEQR